MIRGIDHLSIVEILDQHQSEASMRTQIGRLYYAAFLEARRWCEGHLGYSRIRMAREHQAVANELAGIDLELQVVMRALRETRNAADYDDHLTSAQIVDLLEYARGLTAEFLAKLEALGA